MSPLPVTLRGPISAPAAAAIRDLAGRAAATDGVAPLSEQPLLRLIAPGDDGTADDTVHLLAYDGAAADSASSGALVGYAQLDLGAPGAAGLELVVDPAARRRGIGRGLLDAARALAADGPEDPDGRRFTVWAHGDLPAARALAAGAGLGVVRELWLMSLDLTGWPAAEPAPRPRGVVVRAFVPGRDEDEWRRANARAFASHPEQGRITRQDLDARMAEPWFDPAGFLLAERDGVLLGSVWTKVHLADGTQPAAGEIYVISVDPDAQGLGLGGALLHEGLDHLARRGLTRAILYCDADNEIAIRAYTRVGFRRAGVDVQFG
ncbi:mycothiol synthase [Pengzhenrongella phosphoraccumulans]|uniref:mycothiol synthase n=1 Tax=Pengzhenrongella phosphoraccumulans TaxID=3114394 RepID=UPI0038900B40